MGDLLKNLVTWAVIAIVLMSIFNHYVSLREPSEQLAYSAFLEDVRAGSVTEVNIQSDLSGHTIRGRYDNGKEFLVRGPQDPKLVDELLENNVQITAEPPEKESFLVSLLINVEKPCRPNQRRTGNHL